MSSEIANLDAFKGQRPAAAFANLPPQDDSLATGIGSSYPVIHYKGKVWSVRHKGETFKFLRQDGSPLNAIDLIILRAPPNKSKSFYPEYNEDASAGERPICSSLNGVTPDLDVQQKQSDTCALCPRNVLKTDQRGRRSRECTDYKRLAVLLIPSQTKVLMGEPLMEPVFLRVPAASLNALAVMGEQMDRQGWHYSSYVTRVSFDVNKAYPQFIFTPLQGLSDDEAAVVIPLRDEPQTLRITGEDTSTQGGMKQIEQAAAPQQTAIPQRPPNGQAVQDDVSMAYLELVPPQPPKVQPHLDLNSQPAFHVGHRNVNQANDEVTPGITPPAPAAPQPSAPVEQSSANVDDAISNILAGAKRV